MTEFGKERDNCLPKERKSRPRCVYCKNGLPMGNDEIACYKHGIVSTKGRCDSFKFDPVKHKTINNPDAIASNHEGETGQPCPPEPSNAPVPLTPPKPPNLPVPPTPPKPLDLLVPPTPPKLPDLLVPPTPPKLPDLLTPLTPPKPPDLLTPLTPPKPLDFDLPPVPPVPPFDPDEDTSTADEHPKSKWENRMESFYSDEDKKLWAKSTLKSDGSSDALIKIYEIGIGIYAKKETIRNRIWIHDLFDDNGIEYHIEIEGRLHGKQFSEVQIIYVRPEDKEEALFLIWKFNTSEFITPEYSPEITTQNIVDGVPQKKCPSCSEEIDFDYHKCPHCKTAV